jgi:hypothetical protein
MIKVAIITANLGDFDPVVEYTPQLLPADIEMSVFRFHDENFPPRPHAMTPRMQARIPKMFGWQLVPNFDIYIWVDGSCAMLNNESVKWFVDAIRGTTDIVLFKHPDRKSIREEYEYLKQKIGEGNKYLCARYEGEFDDEQMAVIKADFQYTDDMLYASTCFVYKNNRRVHQMLKEWWYHTSRYHIIDQLSLPYVVKNSDCVALSLDINVYAFQYLTYIRNKKP